MIYRYKTSNIPIKNILTQLNIFILLILGCLLVYGNTSIYANTLYFSFLIICFFYSKNRVFWLAFVFILFSYPFMLFYYRWDNWIFKLTSTVGISFVPIFCLAIFIKYYLNKRNKPTILNHFRNFYILIGIYLIFLLILGLYFGINIKSSFTYLQVLPTFLLYLIIPIIFNEKELIKFNTIIFYFVIIHNLIEFLDIGLRGKIYNMITFNSASKNVILEKEELVRLTGGIVLSLYSIIISIYYIVNKEKAFKSRFLVLVSTISILYIFLSATRGWMIASALLLLYFLFTFIITKKKNIALIFSSLILLVITYFLIPSPIRRNLELSLNRLATLESLAEGNLTAEGTLIRLSERVPKIMSKIQESPIIGFGYSKISAEYYDGHIANHSIILMGGIVGLLLIWGTLFSIFIYLFQIKVYKSHRFRSLAIGLISILVIHSTSRNMISYYMSADASFLICLIFNLVNSSLTRSLK